VQQLGLAPRRRQRPVRRLAHHRGIIAVGDDQPRFAGQVALLLEDSREVRRHRPEEAVAIIEIVEPFAVAEQVGLGDLDLDDGQPPLASIAIMSARRPLGSGISQTANRSWRQNSG
jgi:hypothetical protein